MDHAIGEFHGLIVDELREHATQSVFGDVIDWTDVNDNTVALANKFALLAGVATEAEQESMMRGMLFARRVLRMVYTDQVILPALEYCNDLEVESLREKIDKDTSAYLEASPHVQALLDESMDAIDEGRNFAGSAAKMSAWILMLAEMHMAEEYLTGSFESLDPDMFTGSVS